MIVASTLTTNLSILVLAGFIGFVVISKVPNTLHTPLMSGTNAIHGIVLLGGLLIVGLSGHGTFNKIIRVIGIALGTAVGVPAARQVKMTAMPQMVALFNGVGGGAVFLISWAEFRLTHGFSHTATYITVFSLFAAIVGSVSFWGSNIAFGKLQEILPGRPITLGAAQQGVNLVLLVLALAAAVDIAAGDHSEGVFIGMLVCAALLGNAVVLPIGGADMPVVISMLNACTGLSAAAAGIALNNTAMIVAGMIVGASGSILTNLMAVAMNRSIPAIIAGGFGGGGVAAGAEGAGEHAGTVKSIGPADAAIQLAYAHRVVIVPGHGMAVAQAQHAVRE